MASVDAHRRGILRDLATIIGKDDDLMPDTIDAYGSDGARWQKARDRLVDEFERRARKESGK